MKNEHDEYIVALAEEPANGRTVQDVRLWLTCHTGENDLAEAMALVSNQTGWVADDVDDYDEGTPEYVEVFKTYERWNNLCDELTDRILSLSKMYPEINKQINWEEKIGTHYQVLPFMRLHGYSDKNGWWIKDEKTE